MARSRRFVSYLLAGLAAVTASGAMGLGASSASSILPTRTWMVSSKAVGLIDGYTGNGTLAKGAFDLSTTEETGTPAAGWVTQRTVSFTAYGPATSRSSLLYALAHEKVPAGTVYLLYDDEDWSLTPANERANPGTYMADFVSAAHAHGYKAILAPAIDLARSMSCYDKSDDAAVNYVDECRIPALAAAADPDTYEVQAQLYESDTSLGVLCDCYDWLVLQSVLQSRLTAPLLVVLAGLSTNQNGNVTTPQVLYDDTANTTPLGLPLEQVSGYWLNLPEKSSACPRCVSGGAPQVAAGYLELLGYSS